MVKCLSAFMEACYIIRRDRITSSDLEQFRIQFARFQDLRKIFIRAGVRTTVALPRQHAMSHYYSSIELFGSPNGLCSSITESKHIKAVKEPWRRSNRNEPIEQMLTTTTRLDKMSALRQVFVQQGMMDGTCAEYTLAVVSGEIDESKFLAAEDVGEDESDLDCEEDIENDEAPGFGRRAQSSVVLAAQHRGLSNVLFSVVILN
jgi:hypothetical protein